MTKRPKTPLKIELPLIVFLSVLWMSVWESFTVGTFLIGLAYATFVVRMFYLPALRGTGRVNVFWAAVYALRFLMKMTFASFHVAWMAVVTGPRVRNSIVAVQLRSHDDLIVTLTSHTLALIPGSLVVEVDRTTATLYLHAINTTTQEQIDALKADALRTEALLIRSCGNRSDNALVKAEHRLKRSAGLTPEERRRAFTVHEGPDAAAQGPASQTQERG